MSNSNESPNTENPNNESPITESPISRVVVLGGCGGIGSIATKALSVGAWFDEIVVADVRADAAEAFAASLDRPGVSGVAVDATDPASVRGVIDGASVVVNCVGPFYRFGAPLLQAAIDAGVDYVDVCDDLDATVAQLALDDAAKAAGVCALVGMGNSPGLANVLARYAADELLDEATAVDIMHVHGGEPEEGAAVIKHRIHAMTDPVPVFVDGEFRDVRLLEDSGQELVLDTEFRDVGNLPVYPYPHPETITLPRHFDSLRRATNRGVIFPLPYFELTMETVRQGLKDTAAAGGHTEADVDDWVATISAARQGLLDAAGVTGPAGCLKVVVEGRKDGEDHTYVFSLSSGDSGAGEGTGIPAALGAIMMHDGRIAGAGVHPPEAVVAPMEMLALAAEVIPHFGFDGGLGGGGPLHMEHIGPDGTSESVELPL